METEETKLIALKSHTKEILQGFSNDLRKLKIELNLLSNKLESLKEFIDKFDDPDEE